MALSSDLVQQFVKLTNDSSNKKEQNSTMKGTVISQEGVIYVRLDGSTSVTPAGTTIDVTNGDRVTVEIKDHDATITGCVSSPAGKASDVANNADQLTDFDNKLAYNVSAEELDAFKAAISNLSANIATITDLSAEQLTAINAEIDKLTAKMADIKKITVTDLNAINASIDVINTGILNAEQADIVAAEIKDLKVYTGKFAYLSAENIVAGKLDADFANLKTASIDEAAARNLIVRSGIIKNVSSESGTFTELVGVRIKGDNIEGGTIAADKLIIKNSENGLYYQLNVNGMGETTATQTEYNSLNGKIIAAKTISAEKIQVADLVSFDATIGGFKISDTAIYSGVKNAIDNPSKGIHFSSDGQFSVGDDNTFIKYVDDPNDGNKRKLAIKTGKGYEFSDKGFKITAKDNEIDTTITNNGVLVSRNNEQVLTADTNGVDATNLHASTYLIIGELSRLEDYELDGEKRTGCFWIGG